MHITITEQEYRELIAMKREYKKLKRIEKKLHEKIAKIKNRQVVFPYNYVLKELEGLLT
jgi:hypothetical protein